MTRYLIAGALTCALGLAGCNTSGGSVSTIATMASSAGASLSAEVKGLQAATASRCQVQPTGASVKLVLDAAAGTLSPDDIVTVLCDGLALRAAYASDNSRQPPLPPRRPGTTVTGTAIVNGKSVPVTGVVKR